MTLWPPLTAQRYIVRRNLCRRAAGPASTVLRFRRRAAAPSPKRDRSPSRPSLPPRRAGGRFRPPGGRGRPSRGTDQRAGRRPRGGRVCGDEWRWTTPSAVSAPSATSADSAPVKPKPQIEHDAERAGDEHHADRNENGADAHHAAEPSSDDSRPKAPVSICAASRRNRRLAMAKPSPAFITQNMTSGR